MIYNDPYKNSLNILGELLGKLYKIKIKYFNKIKKFRK